MKKIVLPSLALLFISNLNAQFWKLSDPINLPVNVNSAVAEEGTPIFSPDSSYLYFTRTFDPTNKGGEFDQDIWFSERSPQGTYSDAQQINGLNNKFNNAVVGINATGNRLYVLNSYDGKKDTKKGINVVEKSSDGSWGKPKSMVIPDLDIEGDFYGFHVTPDEKTIIISYKGPSTLGEEDLYVSELLNGEWSAPKHMGSTINTIGFEMSPFLSPNKDTLYFSSNGHGGKGDADIFYSVKTGSWTSWSTPINLGEPFNTEKFDAYFSYSEKYAYWASNRNGDKSNIYMVQILTPEALRIACTSVNISEFGAGNGSIDLTVESGIAPFTYSWSNKKQTEDLISLQRGVYTVLVTDAIGQTAETSCTVTEPEPPQDVIIRLPEVRYPLNEWSLLNDSTINSPDSLLFVYNLLTEYPKLVLELSSHTDARGSLSANQKLAENRARACYKYLVEEKGIDARRIIPIGKGEAKPRTVWLKGEAYLVSKPEDMTGVKEIVLTEKYINKFKKSEKDIFEMLHQLNRRTEGRVLNLDFDAATAPKADSKYLNYVKYP